MDIFAFRSHTDTFGNVVLESLASGVPVVVTSSGGPKYLVLDGVTGIISTDQASLVRGVVELARDSERRENMGVRAREYALCRYWNRIFDQVYDAYEYCLKAKRPAPMRPPVFA